MSDAKRSRLADILAGVAKGALVAVPIAAGTGRLPWPVTVLAIGVGLLPAAVAVAVEP